MLHNRTYLGEVEHKGTPYPGEHDAIVDRGTWDKVHAILAENGHRRASRTRAATPALLKGLIFGMAKPWRQATPADGANCIASTARRRR